MFLFGCDLKDQSISLCLPAGHDDGSRFEKGSLMKINPLTNEKIVHSDKEGDISLHADMLFAFITG